jgi:carbon starvation protein CstA
MEVFSWANQITAIVLWIGAVYLYQKKTHYIIALAPAFITSVVGSYLFYDPTIGFGLEVMTSNLID